MAKKSSRLKHITFNSRVQHLRLINGDEIIGFVIGESENAITVDHPLVVVRVNDENGSYTALQRYIPFAKEKIVHFQKMHVIATTDLHPEIEKYYFLSLKLNANDNRMLSFIRDANLNMEQAMINNAISIANNLDSKIAHIVPGTESKN